MDIQVGSGMASREDKQLEQIKQRLKNTEAELSLIKTSKAYKLTTRLGTLRARAKSDPVGLSKKIAKTLIKDPKKAVMPFKYLRRSAMITQGVIEQNTKYQEWILINEPDETELAEQHVKAQNLKYKPLISIITPVFNPPADVLEELIESVLEQTYENFELCLGNFGDRQEVKDLLEKYAELDARIKYYQIDENLGIASNSNRILEKAKGEFIALLDHDDTLSPNALYESALLLNEKPYDFIYSDKDKIDEEGNRFDPLFKPELSPEMLLNVNYLTHLNVMRTSIVRRVGGWDPETDGAQDWDLFLRVITESKHIGFIPKILYHWRVIETSTALSIETKPYALANQCKAVDKYLAKKGIPAHAYVRRTELKLHWELKEIASEPIIFLYFSSIANAVRIMRKIKTSIRSPQFIVLIDSTKAKNEKQIKQKLKTDIILHNTTNLAQITGTYLKSRKVEGSKTVIFIQDNIKLKNKSEWHDNLTGWLTIPGVAAASGRLVDRHELIVSSGYLVTKNQQSFPLFQGYPRYYQSYLGNAEWVRNLSVLSSSFFATKASYLVKFSSEKLKNSYLFDNYFLWLSKKNRLVMSPHVTAELSEQNGFDMLRPIDIACRGRNFTDPFSSPSMSETDPLRLFEEEDLSGIEVHAPDQLIDPYQHDAIILAQTFDISEDEIAANSTITKNHQTIDPKSVAWFLPAFESVYAGLMNIFSFANYLAETQKLKTTFYILKSGSDVSVERDLVVKAFPGLKGASFEAIMPNSNRKVKPHDIGIATQWASTFSLAKTNTIKRKCYFIQDNEENFYPKGSVSALVEISYRLGFFAIAGTEGLLDMYRGKYQGDGVVLGSLVNLSSYHPRKDPYYSPKPQYKVFFYARPNMPRNAFELGVAGLKILKQRLGNNIEIITAGAKWDERKYGVEGLFTNLGKINYEAVPKLYRSVDAGLMFMFSGHPGVTASELMASGCPVVVNEYDDVTWHELYQHEKTCLVTKATASEVARNLQRCLEDNKLRRKLIDGGLAKTKEFYSSYDISLENAYRAIKR